MTMKRKSDRYTTEEQREWIVKRERERRTDPGDQSKTPHSHSNVRSRPRLTK